MMGALLILWMMILANGGPVELPDRTIRHYGGPNDEYLDRAGTINHATEGDRRPFRGWRS
jgi:hypothetical protein